MLIDFRKNPEPIPNLCIDGAVVERVHEYKYLGTVIDDKLNFNANTDLLNRKCHSCIFFLQKLRSLQVNVKVLQNFYRCFVESVLSFSLICWYKSLTVKNKNVMNRIVTRCGKIVGCEQMKLNDLYECRVRDRAKQIVSDGTHVLAKYFELMPSQKRYRVPKSKTLRYKNSFIPTSILLLNKCMTINLN